MNNVRMMRMGCGLIVRIFSTEIYVQVIQKGEPIHALYMAGRARCMIGITEAAVRQRLREEADPGYREFHSRLLPGITGIAGVRTPALRKIARDLIKDKWQEYVREVSRRFKEEGQGENGVFYDEMILWGLCIAGGCRDWDTARPYVEEFVPAINNWAVCDIFCGSLKIAKRYPEPVWEFIGHYLKSDKEYELRFGAVMLLSHFADQEHVVAALALMDAVHHDGYYVKMAVAWAVSVYFAKVPDAVMPYLKDNHLDDWTYNKALQKITESYRVDKGTKDLIRAMKRPVSRE